MGTILLLAVLSRTTSAGELPRLDAEGDTLPPGAVARLGTTRFRHGGMPTGVVFLDNTTLVSNGADGVLRFWEFPSGRQLREAVGSTHGYAPLVSDGQAIVAIDREYRFVAWEARTGKRLRAFGRAGDRTSGAAVRGDLVAFATEAGVELWDFDGKKPLRTLGSENEKEKTTTMALSADGRVVASGIGTAIRLWDAATGKPLRDLPGHGIHTTRVLTFAPGGSKLLASTGGDETARLRDTETGKELFAVKRTWAYAVAFTPDGKSLAVGGKWDEDGIALYDLTTFRKVKSFTGTPRHAAVNAIVFSPDGRYMACSGVDDTVQVFEIATGRSLHRPDQPQAGISDLLLSPDGKTLITQGDGLEISIWNLETGKRTAVPPEKTGVPAGFGKDGRILVGRLGSFEATFYWYDPATGRDDRVVRVPHTLGTPRLVGDDNTLVIQSTNNGLLAFWDLKRGKELAAPEKPSGTDTYYGFAVSPDGKRIATGGVVRTVPSGELIRILTPTHGRNMYGAAFSPDGKTVATVSALQIMLYDAEGDRPGRALPLADDNNSGYAVAFHPNGKWLAVGERGGVALHDVATGKVVHRWTGHRGHVRALVFTSDGRRLLSGGADATVLLWDVTTVEK